MAWNSAPSRSPPEADFNKISSVQAIRAGPSRTQQLRVAGLYAAYQTFVNAITNTLVNQKDKRWWEASLVEKLALMHSFGEGEHKGMRIKILSVERFAKAKVVDLRMEAKLDTSQMVRVHASHRITCCLGEGFWKPLGN